MTTSMPKYSVARADIQVEEHGTGMLSDVFDVSALSINWNEEILDVLSHGQLIGKLDEIPLSLEGSGTMTMQSSDFDNLIRFARAVEVPQGAVTDGTFTLPAGAKNTGFKLPHGNITALAIPEMELGVDYMYYKTSGIVMRLRDFEAATPGGTYSAGAAREAAVFKGARKYYTLHITDELAGVYNKWFKVRFSLPTDQASVAIDALKTRTVPFTVLLDKTQSGTYGNYGTELHV